MDKAIGYYDTSGIDWLNSISRKLSKSHIQYLNRKAVLPIIHAAVIHNIRAHKRRRPLAQWSPNYKEFRKNAAPKPHMSNKQPSRLGKQELSNSGQVLVLSSQLLHNLGTKTSASSQRVFYGISSDPDNYFDAVINGRSSRVRTVTVPMHTRKAYVDSRGIRHSSTIVKQHTKRMKTGKLPKRNIFYLMPNDTTSISKIFLDYITAKPKVKTVKIKTRLPMTISKVIPIKGA